MIQSEGKLIELLSQGQKTNKYPSGNDAIKSLTKVFNELAETLSFTIDMVQNLSNAMDEMADKLNDVLKIDLSDVQRDLHGIYKESSDLMRSTEDLQRLSKDIKNGTVILD